jgi:DNA-binding NarL/FixJ family response regulator
MTPDAGAFTLRRPPPSLPTKKIAAVLDLSTRTVETHTYEVMRVLGVQSTAELVRYALQPHLA